MTILPSAEIRINYNDVVAQCKESGEPIYLTKNGVGELVVMDIDSFERREQELKMQQMILEAYADRLAGAKVYTTDEVKKMMDSIIED